jgi:hypothetical protein
MQNEWSYFLYGNLGGTAEAKAFVPVILQGQELFLCNRNCVLLHKNRSALDAHLAVRKCIASQSAQARRMCQGTFLVLSLSIYKKYDAL